MQVRNLREGIVCLLMLSSELVVGGLDQPWLEDETGGGLVFGGALAAFAACMIIKNWPLQTLVLGSAILLTWLLSLIIGDLAALAVGCLLLAWVLNGCPSLSSRRSPPCNPLAPHEDRANQHAVDETSNGATATPVAIQCRCGVKIQIRQGYEGNVRCHRCNKIHEVKAAR